MLVRIPPFLNRRVSGARSFFNRFEISLRASSCVSQVVMHALDWIPIMLVDNLIGELVIQLSDSARQGLLMV